MSVQLELIELIRLYLTREDANSSAFLSLGLLKQSNKAARAVETTQLLPRPLLTVI